MIGTKGYEKLKASVESDCNERNNCGCFNPEGCNVPNARIGKYGEEGYKSCFHKYCDKFKWTIDRANHYAEKTGMSTEEILDSWEKDRSYWYMNYYQECNQPEIKEDNVRVFDTLPQLRESVGDKGFRCPSCGGVSKSPYTCDSGLEMRKGKVCDWKSYGLFGTLGKGVNVFVKEKLAGETMFMPIAWEDKE